ncbi:hypothetical protein QDD76_004961 [Burkholderia cepacia]|jgi:hypothetical protein|uniref:Uncharacterized protein n=1 Tax=Burkholderia contaminans TaxID=488447 RepID=A0ABD7YGK8_9BURK|nr:MULTISPECIES: hypothetical protein [Burkholderia]EKS9798968.1 hypothetical protein [Burkholderia cepacia]EKS9805922.1 hypothetical protein [Burkholderia cepacia]EKS9813470.1 hypothetical protein [Burkholderia cepacia]EKS9820309.1 hypothetical protein [Burkholderia cepacia]EKS9828174.1 hypothetical protein [Burkholderia cepacia]
MEQLDTFGLPDTFPPHLMPQRGAQFVADCMRGMSKSALTRLARQRGFMPTWTKLDHVGVGVYGLSLTIDGCGVPLMVRMTTVPSASTPTVAPDRQPSLF